MPEKMSSRRESTKSRSRSLSRRSMSRSSQKRSLSIEKKRLREKSRHRTRTRSPTMSCSRSPIKYKTRYSRTKSRSRSNSSNYRRRRSYSRSPYYAPKRRHVSENPQQSRCIGVFGLSILTDEKKIREIFSTFGTIERVQVVIDAKTRKSRGFCFVYFDDVADAKVAKEQCSGMDVDGRRIRVDYSITQRPHTPTPGIYMGKPTRYFREREYHDKYKNGRSPSPYYRRSSRKYRSRSRSYSPKDRRRERRYHY